MSEVDSAPISTATSLPAPSARTKCRIYAALLSACFPGTGQFLLGQRRHGIVLLVLVAVLICGFWPLRLLRFYVGFLILFSFYFVLFLYASCSASLTRKTTIPSISKLWLIAVVPITLVAVSFEGGILTRASGFRSFQIPSSSMEPTILAGDHIVVDIWRYREKAPSQKDIIVFKQGNIFLLKRVLAVGGDSIQGNDGQTRVNGKDVMEPYVEHTGLAEEWMNNFGTTDIPQGQLFVMGDNRDISFDSRSPDFGMVPTASVIGMPLYVFNTDRPGKDIR